MKLDRNEKSYLRWLQKQVNDQPYNWTGPEFYGLFGALYEFWFNPMVPNDDNRAADGIALRKGFGRDLNVGKDCRMLEMLVALAKRMHNAFYDWELPDQAPKYFWEMLDNLGLSKYTDDYIDKQVVPAFSDIGEILAKLNRREYNFDGSGGGLFPLSVTKTDQREVEIWYQMHAYMLERV